MAEYLVIRFQEDAAQSVSWIAVDDRGTRRGHPGSGLLTDAATEVRDRAVIVLVPAAEAITVSADIPAKGARLLAALPFALEEQLADDIEDLHFAPGTRLSNGQLPVAVVSKEKLAHWIERLADAGIEAARIVPENHGLARTPNTMSMLVSAHQIMFNDGADTEFVVEGLTPSEALVATGALDESAEPSSGHLLVYCDAAINDHFEKDWALLRHELSSVDINILPDGDLPRLAVTVASGSGINLLQGKYGAKTEYAAMFRPWRYAAMFVLAFGVLGIAAKAADYFRLSAEQNQLKQQFTEEYRRIQPNDSREIVDPVATMGSLRRSIGSTSTAAPVFLPSIQHLAVALAENKEVKVENISYRAGVIVVRLSAPNIATLDNIEKSVSGSGQFMATIQSADPVGDRVNSRIQIREAGS
jgi:general secretion pathway protein L